MIGPMIFYGSIAIVFCLALYLSIATCYKTGIGGAIGLGMIVLATGTFLGEAFLNDVSYHVLPQTALLAVGLAVFFFQFAARVMYHSKRERMREREGLDRRHCQNKAGASAV